MPQPLTQQLSPKQTKYKSQSTITKVILNICISCILIGYPNSYFSSIDYQDSIEIFNIRTHQAFYQGFIIGCTSLTASMGGIVSSYMLRYFSRRKCFLILNAINIVVVLGLMIQNLYTLIFFRLIQGCIAGVYSSITPLYIKQFSPLQLNSKMGTFFQMLTVFGLTLSFLITFLLSLIFQAQFYWRLVFIFPLFLLIYQTYNLVYVYPFETPKYLLGIEDHQQAIKLLKFIYKEEYVQQRLIELKKMFFLSSNKKQIELKQKLTTSTSLEIKISEENYSQPTQMKQIQEVKYNNNKLAVLAAIHIANIQPLSGISVVIGYGAQIVKSVFPFLAKILPIFLHFQAVIACLFTIQFLKSYGRKTLYQIGCLGCGILTLSLGYTFTKISGSDSTVTQGILIIVCLFTYRLVYGLTIGPVAFIYIPEIIEPNIMPLIIVIYWLLGALLTIVFPLVRHYIFNDNSGPTFVFFGVYTLISIVINHYLLVQTKDRKQYEIRQQYNKKLETLKKKI